MPERTVEQIRTELAGERQGLAGELDVLHGELRAVVPVALLGVIALALVPRDSRLRTAVKLLWKVR